MRPTRLVLFVVSILALAACADDVAAPADDPGRAAVAAALTIDLDALPSYASTPLPPTYTPEVLAREDGTVTAPITNAGATLGRVLFYDRQLSITGTVSCASCHARAQGFADTARFSVGFDGVGRTTAHAMRLANARFNASGQFFWDRRAATLEAQVTQPIQNAVEMGFDAAHGGLSALLQRIDSLPYYPPLLRLAFGDAVVTEARVQRALAQYVRSLVSVTSRWDQAAAQQGPTPGPFVAFTAQEREGQTLFMTPPGAGGAGCAGCHVPPSFSLAANSRSNGLDAGETRIFRAPSLKNVARSSHFMHDGRFTTLEQVVAFYDSGVQDGAALDNRLTMPAPPPAPPGTRVPQRLGLTVAQRSALVAFLRTLDDDALAADPKFSDPFRRP